MKASGQLWLLGVVFWVIALVILIYAPHPTTSIDVVLTQDALFVCFWVGAGCFILGGLISALAKH